MKRSSLVALARRHRLALSLFGIMAACAVILPACGDGGGSGLAGAVPTTMSIIVTSSPGSGPVNVGSTREYRIEIRDQFSAVITSSTVGVWSIVGTPGVASIVLQGSSLTNNSRGLATCLAPGSVTVNATNSGLSASAALQCDAAPLETGTITIVEDVQPNDSAAFTRTPNPARIPPLRLAYASPPTTPSPRTHTH